MKDVPTIRDSTMESARQERDLQANAIRDMYLEARMKAARAKMPDCYPVEGARNLRAHILGMSLFPSVYNREMLKKAIGPN